VAFSRDGQRLASAGWNDVKVWDLATGRETLTLKGHSGPVECVAFSPDGQRLASASGDGTVKVWDARRLDTEPMIPGPIPAVPLPRLDDPAPPTGKGVAPFSAERSNKAESALMRRLLTGFD
jgi:hypothetical protein